MAKYSQQNNKMKVSKFCCGVDTQTATLAVAVFDMIVGAVFYREFYHLLTSEDLALEKRFGQPGPYLFPPLPGIENLVDRKTLEMFGLCSGIQGVMGGVLIVAAVRKDGRLCSYWVVVTLVTFLFTFPLFLRLHQVCVVHGFLKAIRDKDSPQPNPTGSSHHTTGQRRQRSQDLENLIELDSEEPQPRTMPAREREQSVVSISTNLTDRPPEYSICASPPEEQPPSYESAMELNLLLNTSQLKK